MLTQLNQFSSAFREERTFVNSRSSLEMGLPTHEDSEFNSVRHGQAQDRFPLQGFFKNRITEIFI